MKYNNNIVEFIAINGLGNTHSPKTMDEHLENNDFIAVVFYCKETFGSEVSDDDIEDVLVDFVNAIADDFGYKYGTCSGWYSTIENIKSQMLK